jgi:hypothetical protein
LSVYWCQSYPFGVPFERVDHNTCEPYELADTRSNRTTDDRHSNENTDVFSNKNTDVFSNKNTYIISYGSSMASSRTILLPSPTKAT